MRSLSFLRSSCALTALVLALLLQPVPALANGGDGFGWVFNMLFGNPATQENIHRCAPPNGEAGQNQGPQGGRGGGPQEGMLGIVNSFFCHMERDMGITTTGSATKTMIQRRPKIVSGQIEFQQPDMPVMEELTFTVSASIRAKTDATVADFTNGGTVYDYLGEVWVKRGDVAYSRALRILWSGAGLVSSGLALVDPGAFGDGAGGAMNLKWSRDAGGTGTVRARVFHAMPSLEGGGMTMKMYALGSKGADGVLEARMVASMSFTMGTFSGSHGFRLATRIDTIANSGGVSFEASNSTFCSGDGCDTAATNSAGDAPTRIFCFTRSREAGSMDFTYTPAAPGCTLPAFADERITDVSAYTSTAVLTEGTFWAGMTAQPPL